MISPYSYKPARFFIITFLLTWIPWFICAYLSYRSALLGIQILLMMAGMFVPFITAIGMMICSKNKSMLKTFLKKFDLRKIKLSSWLMIFLLFPISIFLATAISLLFGKPFDQFFLCSQYAVMSGQSILSLVIIFLAPLFEELGWRGYGVDSIRSKFNLFITTLIFASLWALWHLPLFFIRGYYHNVLWNTSIIYTANFFVSIFPAALLINWVYYKNNRSIVAAICMHFILDLFSVLFQTEQFTKCIATILLSVISVILITKDKDLFFNFKEKL